MTPHSCQSRPPKLGIFITSDTFGGAERYIDLLVQALNNEPFSVIVIGRLDHPALPGVNRQELPVGPKWSRRTLLRSLLGLRNERRQYLESMASEQLSIAHLQFKREQVLLSKSLSRELPVVWTEHGRLPSGLYGAVIRFLYRRSARYVKTILCVSQAVVNDLQTLGIDAKKLKLAENPVDVAHFSPDASRRAKMRSDLGLREDEIIILVMSRLDRYKGIHRVIKAMKYLPKNFVLLIAGTGPAESELRQQGSTFGSRVRFLGFRENPRDVLGAADVFCFASTAASGEGVPTMAVLEAMASRLPLVATHDSGLAEWLPYRGGLVADSGEEAIAACLAAAYAQRESLGSEARAAARQHDIELWKSKQREFFLEVLS